MSAPDAVDGSSTGIRMPHCGVVCMATNVAFWHDSAGWGPAHERLLPGVDLPLDAGSSAMPSDAAAPDSWYFRLKITQSGSGRPYTCRQQLLTTREMLLCQPEMIEIHRQYPFGDCEFLTRHGENPD